MELRERVADLDAAHVAFGSIFAVANRLQRVLDQVLPEVSAKQFWVLVMLSHFDEAPTLAELAGACDSSHQNVRQLLGKLQANGFVRLRPDAHDARVTRIEQTEKVSQWSRTTAPQAASFLETMFSSLSPDELETLADYLLTIHATLGSLDATHSHKDRS